MGLLVYASQMKLLASPTGETLHQIMNKCRQVLGKGTITAHLLWLGRKPAVWPAVLLALPSQHQLIQPLNGSSIVVLTQEVKVSYSCVYKPQEFPVMLGDGYWRMHPFTFPQLLPLTLPIPNLYLEAVVYHKLILNIWLRFIARQSHPSFFRITNSLLVNCSTWGEQSLPLLWL